jgi:hypothetical protein
VAFQVSWPFASVEARLLTLTNPAGLKRGGALELCAAQRLAESPLVRPILIFILVLLRPELRLHGILRYFASTSLYAMCLINLTRPFSLAAGDWRDGDRLSALMRAGGTGGTTREHHAPKVDRNGC